MILRLLHAQLLPGRGPALLHVLREQAEPGGAVPDGLLSTLVGFRRDGGETAGLVLTAWRDLEGLLGAAGRPDAAIASLEPPIALEPTAIDHYELVEPVPEEPIGLEGAVLGVVSARVKPHAESVAQAMIRSVTPEIEVAGVLGLYVGRRVLDGATELVALALWADRGRMRRFLRGRPGGALDPEFLAQLDSWSFETYDCLAAETLRLPPSGPAVLLVDRQGALIDSSPGVEAVLGAPGELVLHLTLPEIVEPAARDEAMAALGALWGRGEATGELPFLLPGGEPVLARFRAASAVPEPDLAALVLELRGLDTDRRTVEEIARGVFEPVVAEA